MPINVHKPFLWHPLELLDIYVFVEALNNVLYKMFKNKLYNKYYGEYNITYCTYMTHSAENTSYKQCNNYTLYATQANEFYERLEKGVYACEHCAAQFH